MNITIKPLGGVGQIGSNSTLFSDGTHNFIVDCGILFPNDSHFDINYLIPDLTKVDETIDAIVITHGHEDHIGAIFHFIQAFPNAKIYAPKFARALIIEKLAYKNISKEIIPFYEKVSIGSFDVIPFHVNHSIPDTKGLLINSQNCSILFISDFKVDNTNPYEDYFDFEAIKKHTNNNFKISLLDSTNIRSKNLETPSESTVRADLKKLIKGTKGNTYITTFASNIHRIQTIIDICKEINAAVIPYGQSMKKYIAIAESQDLIDTKDVVFEADNKAIKRKKVIIATGSQGEMRGATNRIASGNDKFFKLKEDDSFIFSSKAIPGNEKILSLVYNKIVSYGTNVFLSDEYKIHVSGHPGRNDLKKVYDTFKPDVAIPIHGESLFLKNHCDFIQTNKLAKETHQIENFDKIIIKNKKVKIVKAEEVPPVIIHGNDLEIDRSKISERRKLATLGVVFISFSKKEIEVTTQGMPELDSSIISELKSHIKELDRKEKENGPKAIRVFTRRYFGNLLGYRPIVIVHKL